MNCCNHCIGADEIFNAKTASRDLKRYWKRGPNKSTRLLLDALRKEKPEGKTLLDIGGGVGVISFELFEEGLAESLHVDASTGYLEVCREEAVIRNLNGQMSFFFGDFTELAKDLKPADIVTLDRVVCCYPDMIKLIKASTDKSLGYIGLVYPRIHVITRIVLSIGNFWFRLRKLGFRTYLHSPDEIDNQIRSRGFNRIFLSRTMIWETVVYQRLGR